MLPHLIQNHTDSANITATYARGTGTNRLEFDFAAPAANKQLRILQQSITLAGSSTIRDAGTSTNADVAFATADVLGAGGVTKASNNDRVTTS